MWRLESRSSGHTNISSTAFLLYRAFRTARVSSRLHICSVRSKFCGFSPCLFALRQYISQKLCSDTCLICSVFLLIMNWKLEITWPFDFDAHVVFRSVDFVKYFIILSVNFEPLCIGPVMSASAVGGGRRGEIGRSPVGRGFEDSAISREDIDVAIAGGIGLAFGEQRGTLDSVVASAVGGAVVLVPALRELCGDVQAAGESVGELGEEFGVVVAAARQTRGRVDSVRADACGDGRTVTDLGDRMGRLAERMADVEDGSGGGGLGGGLRSAAHSHLPCAGVAWWIGDPGGVPGGLVRWGARRTMSHYCFFLTLVQSQPPREKAWFRFWGRWRRLVSSPSSLIRR